jgi:hypothetical protein
MLTFLLLLNQKGFAKLYSGLGPTIIRSFFATGALFVAVSETDKFLTKLLIKD